MKYYTTNLDLDNSYFTTTQIRLLLRLNYYLYIYVKNNYKLRCCDA